MKIEKRRGEERRGEKRWEESRAEQSQVIVGESEIFYSLFCIL